MKRRKFIKITLASGSTFLIPSCSNFAQRMISSNNWTYLSDVSLSPRDFGARLVENLFIPKSKKKYGKGRNARKYSNLAEIFPKGMYDLSELNANSLIMTDENYYTRTEKPNLLNLDNLTHIKISGLIDNPGKMPIKSIVSASTSQGVTMMECAGNDKFAGFRLMSAANWDGVSIEEFLQTNLLGFTNLKSPTHVLISGFDKSSESGYNFLGVQSTAGASWIFDIKDLIKQNAFLATKMNGKPLSPDRGFPCRLVVPGWYGCASIKWVNEMHFFNAHELTKTTAQMKEFSDRTHQTGVPELLTDYKNPVIDFAATPAKIEKWQKPNGTIIYRIMGLMWGGDIKNPDLRINISKENESIVSSDIVQSKTRSNILSWQHWWYWWEPKDNGRFQISLNLENSKELSRRIDRNYYQVSVKI